MKLFTFAAVLVAIAVAFRLEGSTIHQVAVILPLIYVWGPWMLLLLFWLFLDYTRYRRTTNGLKKAILFSLIIGGAMALSAGIGHALDDRRTKQVETYVAEIAPLLDAYKNKHGSYPRALTDPDLHAPSPPLRLATEHGYTSDGSSYTFAYRDSSMWEGMLHYDSGSREWEYLDD